MEFINEKNYEIDTEKVVSKWKPIMEAMKIEDNTMKIFLSAYSEIFALNDTKKKSFLSDVFSNLLPINLRILSKLNLENKTVILSENSEYIKDYGFPFTLKKEDLVLGIDVVSQIEHEAIEEISNMINLKIKDFEKLYINEIVSEIKVEDNTDYAKVIYFSRFGIN